MPVEGSQPPALLPLQSGAGYPVVPLPLERPPPGQGTGDVEETGGVVEPTEGGGELKQLAPAPPRYGCNMRDCAAMAVDPLLEAVDAEPDVLDVDPEGLGVGRGEVGCPAGGDRVGDERQGVGARGPDGGGYQDGAGAIRQGTGTGGLGPWKVIDTVGKLVLGIGRDGIGWERLGTIMVISPLLKTHAATSAMHARAWAASSGQCSLPAGTPSTH